MSTPTQLGLEIQLPDDYLFSSFIAQDAQHSELVSYLRALSEQGEHSDRYEIAGQMQTTYLWGASGAGLSHLLQATCAHADKLGHIAQYLPLRDMAAVNPLSLAEALQGVELICVDDIGGDDLAGYGCIVDGLGGDNAGEALRPTWERGLFNLYNELLTSGCRFVFAGHQSPSELQINLPDLKSRVLSGAVFKVSSLKDEALPAALIHQAASRGMALNQELANYILSRAPRDLKALSDILAQLDRISLAEQRRLTIPFVRKALGWV